MLRKQNICSKSMKNFDPKKSLIRGDLKWLPDTDALWFRARFSKTNLFGEREHVIPLQYNGGPLCPVTAFFQHLEATRGGDDMGPAFIMIKRGCYAALGHTEFYLDIEEITRNYWRESKDVCWTLLEKRRGNIGLPIRSTNMPNYDPRRLGVNGSIGIQ